MARDDNFSRHAQRGLAPEEARQPPLEFDVEFEGPVQEARAAARRAEPIDGLVRRGDDMRMVGEAEVVVAPGHDETPAVHLDFRPQVLADGDEVGVEALGFDLTSTREASALLEQIHRTIDLGSLAGPTAERCSRVGF
jgi:hypothetical protein